MSSHREKACSSSSSAARKGDDAVKPVKLSFREMLSYGHKPWDEDYREQKQALEEAFTQADRQAAAEAQEKNPSNQRKLSVEQSGYSASDDEDDSDDDYGVAPVTFTDHEMLCYGHKPWDNDYYEWKEAYEKAFTKSERQAAKEARSEAGAGKTVRS